MSLTISTPQQIRNAPYNNSTAKMQYSFPKDRRFRQNKQNSDRPYYDINGQISKRSTNFGYGSKYDFTKDMPKSPPSTLYQIKSVFQENKGIKKGFGFGNRPLAQTINNKNPGPGAYQIPSTRSRCYYSIKGKRRQLSIQNSPGPDNYQIQLTLNKTGTNFSSRFRNHQGLKFYSSTQRFRKTNSDYPGPGNYTFETIQINSEGRYSLSRLHNSKVSSSGNSKRKSINQNRKTPGPGNYRLPSDFGYYASKKQFLQKKTAEGQKTTKPRKNLTKTQN